MNANQQLIPTLPADAPCRLVVERIDPAAGTCQPVYETAAHTRDEGVQVVESYLKRRHQRGWWIWCTGWMEYTCVKYDGGKLEGQYLNVRLVAANEPLSQGETS